MTYQIVCADVMEWAAAYDGPKFHALLTDPPYELNFMGRVWDRSGIPFQPETWAALAEHLLPGGFVMAFGSSRTSHRLACAMEDAGMVLQPQVFVWTCGSSFPKATRIDTKIDEAAGMLGEREVTGSYRVSRDYSRDGRVGDMAISLGPVHGAKLITTTPATPLARAWEGHRYGGQILKDAATPIVVAQKPWSDPRLDCIVETGAGAMWIEGARIGTEDVSVKGRGLASANHPGWKRPWHEEAKGKQWGSTCGRWPSNFALVHNAPSACGDCDGAGCEACGGSGLVGGCRRVGVKRVKGSQERTQKKTGDEGGGRSLNTMIRPAGYVTSGYADPNGLETIDAWECEPDCPARRLGEQSGVSRSVHVIGNRSGKRVIEYGPASQQNVPMGYDDTGTAARFFYQADWRYEIAERLAGADPVRYCAKASKREREAGLESRKATVAHAAYGDFQGTPKHATNMNGKQRNVHPTVKPISLCKWLSTLLLPPGEYAPRRIMVPFAGSGSEMIAAVLTGWDEVVGIELQPEYVEIAEARVRYWATRPRQLELDL